MTHTHYCFKFGAISLHIDTDTIDVKIRKIRLLETTVNFLSYNITNWSLRILA